MRVRIARPEDEARISVLLRRFEGESLPAWRDPAALARSAANAPAKLFHPPPGDYVLMVCVEEDDRPIGVAQAMMDKDFFTEEPQGHLLLLVTDAAQEGRGVARCLVDAVGAWAREKGGLGLLLYVFATNERARAAYLRFGFQEDMVKMVKPLGDEAEGKPGP